MLLATLIALAINPVTATVTVHADKPGIKISPDLYGIFFEEINCGGDGGLYGELIRNRSFEDSDKPDYWAPGVTGSATGEIALDRTHSMSAENPTALRLTLTSGKGEVSADNKGYWGIPVRKGEPESLSFYARCDEAAKTIYARLIGKDGSIRASQEFAITRAGNWGRLDCTLLPTADDADCRLVLSIDEPGSVWLDMVSLFPQNTFKNRGNGMRRDLALMLSDLKPSFMRFPGGCWVEGDTMAFSQRWKRTVGELRDRRTQYDLWQYTSTNGLGFHEYLQFCEDIGAAPLFVVNCGMSHKEVVPLDKMGEFIQDALDAIEYANGPVTSKWGAMRAANGHLAPFKLKYLEIGNENGGPAYRERFPLIARAVKARFPDIKIIANVWGGYPNNAYAEIIDEHYYSNPEFFFENAERYDKYDRRGPKVYVGEYAVTEGCGGGNLIAAIGEAAFMTGMERNSDVVAMASYAPLFANVNHKTWNPDLINFDNHRSFGTPSYYVQSMFSRNRGDRVLPADISVAGGSKPSFPNGGIGVGTWGTQAEFKDVNVVSGKKVLFESPDGSALTEGSGTWKRAVGALAQTGGQDGTRATAGSAAWSNYTLTLKARKTGGREGFLITIGQLDDKNWIWWNVGGWGNHQHALERSVNGGKTPLGQAVPGAVETGRWYEIKIEYTPERVRCYLDGKLLHDVAIPAPKPLHMVASRSDQAREVILKVVNSSTSPIRSNLKIEGFGGSLTGSETVLTSASPLDENTLDHPDNVLPVQFKFESQSPRFTHKFPPYSVSVLRIHQGRQPKSRARRRSK